MTPRRNQIAALGDAIAHVQRSDAAADTALSAFFRAHPEVGAHDRAFVSDTVFAYLRRKRSLESLAQTNAPRRLGLATLVREFGHSVRELEPALNASDARWLAEFKSRVQQALPPAVAADVPDWLWTRFHEGVGAPAPRGFAPVVERWRRAHERASRHHEVGAEREVVAIYQEVLLLGAEGGVDAVDARIAQQLEQLDGALREHV